MLAEDASKEMGIKLKKYFLLTRRLELGFPSLGDNVRYARPSALNLLQKNDFSVFYDLFSHVLLFYTVFPGCSNKLKKSSALLLKSGTLAKFQSKPTVGFRDQLPKC